MSILVTPSEVEDSTGISVSAYDITQAQLCIQIATGLNLSADNPELRFTKRNLRLLKDAVTLQTAFLQSNPDVLTSRSDVSSVSQKNISVSYSGTQDAFLSPLVKELLKSLTGSGIRTIAITPGSAKYYESPLTDEIVWNY